jgi:hypothetical protein
MTAGFRRIAFGLSIIVLASAWTASGGDHYDILINDDNSSVDQINPRVASGAAGIFLIVWVDKRDGQNDIYCQFYDTSGRAIGENILINDDGAGINQSEPACAGNRSGQFASAWKDYRNGDYPYRPDIYYSRVDSNGIYGNMNATAEPPDSTKETPDIALFSDGSAIVVWSDYRNRNWDIYGQKLTASGSLRGSNFKINSESGIYQQHSPRVAAFGDGGFVAVWYDNRNGNDDIFGQIYSASGAAVGSNIKLSDDPGVNRQAFPAVATDGSKRFVVAWVDWRNGVYPQNPDIYYRRFDSLGNPQAPSFRINLDGGTTAQRDVSLCSDWLGNIAAVWSDSSGGQWDAVGQIIDNSGAFAGTNFRIHQNLTGRQLQPDVDADGYNLFFVWADSRNGNFDVYAAIKQYNKPSLVVKPSSLHFIMEQGGSLPPPQTICINNAGLGALAWTATHSEDWLAIVPSEGVTPESCAISIIDGTLPYGEYFANMRIINRETLDSSIVAPIILSVTAPLIELTPDTISLTVYAAMGNPPSQPLQIVNAGSGAMSWSAAENISWCEIDAISGTAPATINLSPNIAGLDYGEYQGAIEIASPEAANSPETAIVILRLIGNIPYLSCYPESLIIQRTIGDTAGGSLQILNLGDGTLNWSAFSPADWIAIANPGGSDNDFLIFNLETSNMSAGEYQTAITIFDTMSFNDSISAPIYLRLLPPETAYSLIDTVYFGSDSVYVGEAAAISLTIMITGPRKGLYIPFDDYGGVDLDSIKINADLLPSYATATSAILPGGAGEIGIRVGDDFINDSVISAGQYNLGTLFFNGREAGTTAVDTARSDSSGSYTLSREFQKNPPIVKGGRILIESRPFSPPDTLIIFSGGALAGETGVIPIGIRPLKATKKGFIPLAFLPDLAELDSISIDHSGIPSYLEITAAKDATGGAKIGFSVSDIYFSDSSLEPGNYTIASLHFTAGSKPGVMQIDTCFHDSSSVYFMDETLSKNIPAVASGTFIIDAPTRIESGDVEAEEIEGINLAQNSPNPFNASTAIAVYLPCPTHVSVQIFNLLGQEVATLRDGVFPAGKTELIWNGMIEESGPAPAGIYFYKLRGENINIVKKMVLLK